MVTTAKWYMLVTFLYSSSTFLLVTKKCVDRVDMPQAKSLIIACKQVFDSNRGVFTYLMSCSCPNGNSFQFEATPCFDKMILEIKREKRVAMELLFTDFFFFIYYDLNVQKRESERERERKGNKEAKLSLLLLLPQL